MQMYYAKEQFFRSSQQHFELINSFEPLSMAPLTQDLVYFISKKDMMNLIPV